MTSLSNYKPRGSAPTQGETQMLEFALGTRNCSSGVVSTATNSWVLALFATIAFILLTMPPVNAWFHSAIPNNSYRVLFQALIFFVIIYLLDVWAISWRESHPVCK